MTSKTNFTMAGALFLTGAALVTLALAGSEESGSLTQEVSELRKGQEAILKDLGEIKKLLLARPAPPPITEKINGVVGIGSIAPRGEKTAPLTLIEFSDYQCPFCNRHVRQTMPQLIKDYVDTGKVRYVFRDFPLESIHPNAVKAAEAARCAGDQDKYWEMHDQLFANQRELQAEKLPEYAKTIGLNEEAFKACLDQGKYAEAVKKDIEEASKLGIRGTPTLVLGISDGDQAKDGVMIRGAHPLTTFKTEIDKLLAPPPAVVQK